MKLRNLLVGYTIVMLLILGGISQEFDKQTKAGKDMVYYNEQHISVICQIEKSTENIDVYENDTESEKSDVSEIEKLRLEDATRKRIEEQYDCQIIFWSDEDYEIQLQDALKNEAVILDYAKDDKLIGKIIWNDEEKQYQELETQLFEKTMFIWGVIFVAGYLLFVVFYTRFIRPFHKLQKFSGQIAKGNLDAPLLVEKENYFGAFTESFDLMREELKHARESEFRANQSKKELIAQLSHDIKTPVATIQATCEVLQMKEKNADTLNKVGLIDTKAKLIQKLVDNLFHATLEELEVLKVEPIEESSLCMGEMCGELTYYGDVEFVGQVPECLVYMDKLRLQQVIDNCLNNAWKYAGTPIIISYIDQPDGIIIKIKDYGNGVDEEELPLILEKFYRGENAKGKEGSGLGLYLAKTFMQKMKGDMEYYNEDGFVVELFLKKV